MYATLRVSKGDNGVERGVANQAVQEGFLGGASLKKLLNIPELEKFKGSSPNSQPKIRLK